MALLRLDALCADITLHIALHLEFGDLLNLALTCKSLYAQLCAPDVQSHWRKHIPSALLPVEELSRPCNARTIHTAIRHLLSLRSVWASQSMLQAKRSVEIVHDTWMLHLPSTRWMFTFRVSNGETNLRCFDLMSGEVVGEMKVCEGIPSTKLLAGQELRENATTLAYIVRQANESQDTYWEIKLLTAEFSVQAKGISASFFPVKAIHIPHEIASAFASFNRIELEGNHIVLSGNWTSRHFLMIDWIRDDMALFSCSTIWRTFEWKLIGDYLVISHDDHYVFGVDVAKYLDTPSSINPDASSINLFTASDKGGLEIIKRGHNSFCVMVISSSIGKVWYDFNATQITIGPDGTPTTVRDHFDKIGLRPRFPELYEYGLPLYVGTSIAFLDAMGLIIYVDDDTGAIREKAMSLVGSIVGIEEIDREIGMIAVRESDGMNYSTRVYWLA